MIKKTTLIIVLTVLMVTMTFAQGRGRNRAANRAHTFDVTAPVDITGKIVKVESVNTGKGWYGTGIHLTVADGAEQFPVALGPSGYLNARNWAFKEGEAITLKAFKGTGNDNGTWFAAGITRNGTQLSLRDTNGFPMWRRSVNGRRGGGRGAGRAAGRGGGRRFNQ